MNWEVRIDRYTLPVKDRQLGEATVQLRELSSPAPDELGVGRAWGGRGTQAVGSVCVYN